MGKMNPKRREAEVKSLNRMSIIRVDAIPPTVNHYVKHTRNGRHYKTQEARTFAELLALSARGAEAVFGSEFQVEIEISMGKGQKGDIDNFPKVVLDSLAKLEMLRNGKNGRPMSDSHVTRLEITKERGESPRTTITLIGVA